MRFNQQTSALANLAAVLSRSIAVLLCLIALPARGQWQLVSQSDKQDLGHGAWHTMKKAKGPREMELTLVFFDAKTTRMEIVAQTTPDRLKARTLAEVGTGSGAIAVCNGGYFTPEFGPSGSDRPVPKLPAVPPVGELTPSRRDSS